MERQTEEIAELNERLTRIRILAGVEVDIRADGSLDLPDEVLAERDWVMASIHSGFDQPRERLTERLLAAMANPHVDCIGHPTGRKINRRVPYELDFERVLAAALETGTFLEINAQPDRLDLSDTHARAAAEAGVLLVVSTDAHRIHELENLELGVAQARRGWIRRRAGREHAYVGPGAEADEVVTEPFREDAAAAAEWVARYLEGVRELPVLSRVEPGEVRAALPASPPDAPEPFSAVLRDLDEILIPGITHWNHPRFFAYFSITGSEPGILAEFLAAALNVNAMLWRTSPAATELEELAVDWLRQLIGLPEGLHGHIEDTASTSTLAALAAARHLRPGGAVVCSEHAHSSVDKAARLLELPLRKVPADDEFRMRPDALADGARRGRGRCRGRHGGDDVEHVRGSRSRDRRPLRRVRRLAPRGRRLRRTGRRLRGAPLGARGRRAGGLPRRQPAQMALHPDRLLRALHAPPRRAPRRVQPRARVPTDERRGRHEPHGLRPGARPPVPGLEAVGGHSLLRARGAPGAHPRARPPGAALRLLGRGDAGLGGRRPGALLRRLLPPRGLRRGERGAARAREPKRGDLHLPHGPGRALRPPPRDRQPADDRGRRAARLGRPPPRGGS